MQNVSCNVPFRLKYIDEDWVQMFELNEVIAADGTARHQPLIIFCRMLSQLKNKGKTRRETAVFSCS